MVNFNFYNTAPEGFKPLGFSVRWSGVLTPPTAGTYEIGFRMSRRTGQPPPNVKVWIDDKLVVTPELSGIDANNNAVCIAGNCSQNIKPIMYTFADTKPRKVRIDYVRATEDRASTFDWVPPVGTLLAPAVEAAKNSDAVVAFVGLSPDLEGEEMKVNFAGFRGGDRTTLSLPESQRKLLEAVKATGKPLVVVYMTGGAISDPWVEQHADAIVQGWYPGEAAGTALANVLTGKANPGGRLPYTIYKTEKDLPPFDDYAMDKRGYRYFKGPVFYPFGHGLSYTSFAYAKPAVSGAKLEAGKSVKVSVNVRNSGRRDGDEVVQLYVAKPGDKGNPSLAAFRRVHLKAGASETVTLEADARALSLVDAKGARSVKPGVYKLHVGGGQPKYVKAVSANVTVTDEAALPK